MAQPGRGPSLSNSSAEASGTQKQRAVPPVSFGHIEPGSQSRVEVLNKVSPKNQEPANTTGDDMSETDMEDLLESQDDVVSYEINLGEKKINVGLLNLTPDNCSAITNLFDESYTVNVFQGHVAKSQHSTTNMLKTDEGFCSSAGVYIYDTQYFHQPHELEATLPMGEASIVVKEEEQSQQVLELVHAEGSSHPDTFTLQSVGEMSVQGQVTVPPRTPPITENVVPGVITVPPSTPPIAKNVVPRGRVYISTVAHLWKDGNPKDGAVQCMGKVNLSANKQIARCSFTQKQCTWNQTGQSPLICNFTNGDGPQEIFSKLRCKEGIDVCLIPLQYDGPSALQMLHIGNVGTVVTEHQWEETTPVFVMYGQNEGNILEATITKPHFCQKVDSIFYRRIMEYELKFPDRYKTQRGDCGCPLFTVVAGKVRVLGFHVAAREGTAICCAVPAERNLQSFPTPVGYRREICIPATLNARIEERAAMSVH